MAAIKQTAKLHRGLIVVAILAGLILLLVVIELVQMLALRVL